MKIDTFKHNCKIDHHDGLVPTFSLDNNINYFNFEPNEEILCIEYREGIINLGPNHKITITGNIKDAAFGLAGLIADNLQDITATNNNVPMIFNRIFEIEPSTGILNSRLETSEEISKFITEFNKIWKSVLLLG